MNRTSIEWTDWSVNPLKLQLPDGTLVNACVKHSTGCASCYAESIVRRYWPKSAGEFPGYSKALMKLGKPFLVGNELEKVLRLDQRIAAGKANPEENKIFWSDMTDEYWWFWPDEMLDKIWAVRALTPNLVHQVLTKRAGRMAEYLGGKCRVQYQDGVVEAGRARAIGRVLRVEMKEYEWGMDLEYCGANNWPLPNVWCGVSVENQEQAGLRIPHLLRTLAAVRWLSCEPLLGPLDLHKWVPGDVPDSFDSKDGWVIGCYEPNEAELEMWREHFDWCVIGGESGHNARPCNLAWIRSLVQQCKAAGVPVFVKQLGSKPHDNGKKFGPHDKDEGFFPRCWRCGHYDFGPCGDGTLLCNGCDAAWDRLKDSKGGDISEWPEDVKIRQFPEVNPCGGEK